MKAKRLVLCIFLSLALIVTFIPLTSYAAPGDEHPVSFNGISFTDNGDNEYYANLEHGKVWAYGDYDSTKKSFNVKEGEKFYIDVNCDSGWFATVQYSVDSGNKIDAEYDGYEYYFQMPENAGNYSITVYIAFVQSKMVKSVNVEFIAPLCGTVVKGTDWSGTEKQTPQPGIILPTGANYVPEGDEYENYGKWLNEDEDAFTGTINGNEAYIAMVYLKPTVGAEFDTKATVKVTGGNLIFKNVSSGEIKLVVQVHAAHNYTHVVNKAGLLKNGNQYDQCVGCGVTQNNAVIPGWSKSYVKAPKTVAGKKSFTVKWKKQSKANQKKFNGYQIRYSTKKSMAKAKTVKVKKTASSKTIKNLKKKTKYFVQVRTYTKKSGKTFYSKWSAKKTVKTK